jgi:hypothetical protein
MWMALTILAMMSIPMPSLIVVSLQENRHVEGHDEVAADAVVELTLAAARVRPLSAHLHPMDLASFL